MSRPMLSLEYDYENTLHSWTREEAVLLLLLDREPHFLELYSFIVYSNFT
jgi:hypothetical protein